MMGYRKKMPLVTAVLVMVLIFMMSATVYADGTGETGNSSESSDIMDALKGALGTVDLSGVNLQGLNAGGLDLGGVDLKGIAPKGVNPGDVNLNPSDLNDKAVEYLKSLGYTDSDIEKLKSSLPGSVNEGITAMVNAALAGKEKADESGEKLQQAEEPEAQIYVVKRGDTLSKIAKKVYGDSSKWNLIYKMNKDQIRDPNKIEIGQRLKIA